jgi:acyl-CoA hydrolase
VDRAGVDEVLAIRPGSTVALGDGSGAPTELLPALSEAARATGDLRLLLGWCTVPLDGLDFAAFADVSAFMGGYATRRAIDAGLARYLPARLGTWPALVHDVIRPDTLVVSVVRCADGYRFVTESAWMWSVVDRGAQIVAIEIDGPQCVIGPPLPPAQLRIVDAVTRGPVPFRWTVPTEDQHAIAARIADLVPPDARLQFAPGALGSAVIDALHRPIRVDTGVLTEAVVRLDERGLLVGDPVSAYAVGSAELFEWLDGRAVLDRAEVTHDAGRLRAAPPLIAVNTALEMDVDGQVNVEAVRGSAVAAIGGQPDYMAGAAAAVGGLSIVAVPTTHAGRPTLVDSLSGPPSTASHDVELVVTERGVADLRGLDRTQRRAAIRRLWAD